MRVFRFTVFALLLLTGMAFALDVDINEIRTGEVVFENYAGVGIKADSTEDILSIGRQLSRSAKRAGIGRRVAYGAKYSVIRVITAAEPEKYSADIMFVDKDAKVTHIANLRKIISGYLSNMYGYSLRQAQALAVFITYYNALHRQDTDYFSSKYKTAVMKHVSQNNAGLSVKYAQWPGATAMLIPLTSEKIDPFAIGEKDTIEALRRDKQNIDDRKELTNLKKDAVNRDKEEFEKQRKSQREKEEAIRKQKEETAEKKKAAEESTSRLEKEKAEAAKIADENAKRKKQEEIKKREEALKKEKSSIEKQEKEAAKKQERLDKDKSEADKKEKDIKDKEKEIRDEERQTSSDEIREDIKSNPEKAAEKLEQKAEELEDREAELDKREDRLRDANLDKSIFGDKLYYLKVKEYIDGGHYNNELLMIDPADKKVAFKSQVTNICGRRYDVFSRGVAVITHKGSHNSEHNLTLVDRETLKEIKSGADDIFWRSFIEIRGGFIYAITVSDKAYYLGKFDENLQRVAVSSEKINENTFISFYEDLIYINGEDKQIMIFKSDDLALVDIIQP